MSWQVLVDDRKGVEKKKEMIHKGGSQGESNSTM